MIGYLDEICSYPENIRLPGWTASPVEPSVKKLRFKSAVVNKIGRGCSLQLRMSSTQIFQTRFA